MPVVTEVKKTLAREMQKAFPEPAADDLLSRNYLLNSTVWSTAATQGTQVTTVALPGAFASFDYLQKKLADFFYVQLDVEVEVKLVCSKYHYGALLISRSYGRAEATGLLPWTMDWRQRAGLDAAVLACNDVQACKMLFSWNLPSTFMVNSSWASQLGNLYIHVLHPIASIDPNPPNTVVVQTWGRIARIRLQGPDQLGGPPMMSGLPHVSRQSRRGGGTPEHEAREKAKEGILTQVAEATSQIAPHLSKIPVVGGIADTVGAVTKMALPMLRAFGWNKPTDISKPVPYFPAPMESVIHMAGSDPAVRLDDRIDDLTTMDETTCPFDSWSPDVYQYIRRLGYLQSGTWTAASAISSSLASWPVSPFYSADDAQDVSGNYKVVPTPLAWMSQYFGFYRGSINYAIFVCGNSFLSGVLRVTYSPSGTFPATMENYGGDFVSRLVEVKGPTWILFTVPYLYSLPWNSLKPSPKLATTSAPRPFGANRSSCTYPTTVPTTGAVQITVAEPLVVTSTTVNPLVYFSIFQGAGADFQFRRFVGRDKNAVTTISYYPPAPVGEEKPRVEKQCDLVKLSQGAFAGLQEHTSLETDDGLVFNKRALPFVEILHRYSVGLFPQGSAGVFYIPVEPFWTTGTFVMDDFFSELVCLFRYWRGALRFWRSGHAGGDVVFNVVPQWDADLATPYFQPADMWAPGTWFDTEEANTVRGGSTIEVPWTSCLPYKGVFGMQGGPGEPYNVRIDERAESAAIYGHAAGDDFGLCGALPPPVITVATGTTPLVVSKEKQGGLQLGQVRERQKQDILKESIKRKLVEAGGDMERFITSLDRVEPRSAKSTTPTM